MGSSTPIELDTISTSVDAVAVMTQRLRKIIDATNELFQCTSLDDLYRSAIVIARDKLGIERCGMYTKHGDWLQGTFGTDINGDVVDERKLGMLIDQVWIERIAKLTPEDAQWIVTHETRHTYNGDYTSELQKGWIAITPIKAANRFIGIMFNDGAISGTPLNSEVQEILCVFCALLGSLIEGKEAQFAQAAERQRMNEALELRVEERTAELRAANDEVRRFAYIVSHDLRSPLVNVKGFAGELEKSLQALQTALAPALPHLSEQDRARIAFLADKDIPECMHYIDISVERMDYFINAVLNLSRLGQRELLPETVDTSTLVDDTLESLAHQIQTKQISIHKDNLPVIEADRMALAQIFGNILTNAVLYIDSDRPAQITISASVAEGETRFAVKDNGRGIAQQDFHKVFEPFRRAGKQTVSGEGMGLAYVQALVRRHGGKIWFESELDVGTTFYFTIPLHLDVVV